MCCWSVRISRMFRTQDYKYIAYKDDACEQLFDMNKDPGETKNLAGSSKYESIVKAHRDILVQWERRLDVSPNVPHGDMWSAT